MRPWRQEPGPRTHASRLRGLGTSLETQEARRVSCSRGGLCGAAVTSTCSDTWGSVSGHLRERWKGPLSQPTPVLATRKTSSVGPRLSPACASAFQPASGVPLSSPSCVREVRESGPGFRPQDTARNFLGNNGSSQPAHVGFCQRGGRSSGQSCGWSLCSPRVQGPVPTLNTFTCCPTKSKREPEIPGSGWAGLNHLTPAGLGFLVCEMGPVTLRGQVCVWR